MPFRHSDDTHTKLTRRPAIKSSYISYAVRRLMRNLAGRVRSLFGENHGRAPLAQKFLPGLNLETDVHRTRRMRERADTDQINARLRIGTHIFQRNPAG
jgi:hypothetical protein